MNEELTLAIDELRRRPADRAWFIPVLINKCSVPGLPIGAGERLSDIQYISLHRNWSTGIEKIISSLRSRAIETDAYIYPLCMNDIGDIFYGDSENKVYRQRGKNRELLYSHKESITAIASNGGGLLISGGRDGRVIAYNYSKKIKIDNQYCGSWVYGLAFICESVFACGSNDGRVRIFEVIGDRLHIKYNKQMHADRVHDIVAINTSFMVSCGKDNRLSFLDINSESAFCWELSETPYCLAYREGILAIGTNEGCVILFNIKEKKVEDKFRLHSKRINGIAFLDSKRLVVGSRDHSISLFDVDSKIHAEKIKLDGEVNRVIASGNEIFAGTDGNYLYHHSFGAG